MGDVIRRYLSAVCQLALMPCPWPLRRYLLKWLLGFCLEEGSRIGLTIVLGVRSVRLERGATIGHLNFIRGLDELFMGRNSFIGRLNWITAFPTGTATRHFALDSDRRPSLTLGAESAITSRHLIDCTGSIAIGQYSTVAGYRSTLLTHSIDIDANRQSSKPIVVGAYCFVGTGCTLLPGAALPDYSVLGACSLLNKRHTEPWCLYGGVPAKYVAALSNEARYFTRDRGFVD